MATRIIISITTQTAGVDFPGGAVDKNPPDNAGVGGSIPEPLSHDHGVCMLRRLKPAGARALQKETPLP